jgi:hypothetical protein
VAGVRVEIIHLEMCQLIIMKMGGKAAHRHNQRYSGSPCCI